jgi:drug/metabolite transporter (DMT)-like permease
VSKELNKTNPSPSLSKLLIIRSIFGGSNMLILNAAVILIDVHNVSIVQNTGPFFTLVLAFIFVGEHLTWQKILCCIGCFLGIILIVDPHLLVFWEPNDDPNASFSSGFILGNLLMLLWSLNRAVINILLKKGKVNSWQLRSEHEQPILRGDFSDDRGWRTGIHRQHP